MKFSHVLVERTERTDERTDILKETLRDNRQVGIVDAINIMNIKDVELTKEELTLSFFPKLLNLEKRYGVELGTAYQNHNYAGKIIDYIYFRKTF